MRSLQRCRIAWKALFLSDLTLADWTKLYPNYWVPPSNDHMAELSYRFGVRGGATLRGGLADLAAILEALHWCRGGADVLPGHMGSAKAPSMEVAL